MSATFISDICGAFVEIRTPVVEPIQNLNNDTNRRRKLAREEKMNTQETTCIAILWEPFHILQDSIDPSHSNGYSRSCPTVGVGGYIQTKRDGRVASSRRIRVGSWNIGTLTGKFFELVDALRRKKVDIACFQETKWKGSRTREGNQYKLWYSGSATARNSVGVALAPDLKDKVVQVIRISEEETINVISAYAPQVGLGEAEKKNFWDSLDDLVRECSMTQQLIIARDLNGHVGANADGFSSVHGGFGYGVRNDEGRTILEFAVAHDLVVVNSFFKKRDVHLITFHSGDHDTQIDYILLGFDIHIKRRPCSSERSVKPRILWKNLYGEAAEDFRARVIEGVTPEEEDGSVANAEQMWNRLANTIREAAKETLGVVAGTLRTRIGHMESWWISDEPRRGIRKQKREAKKAVARAKEKAYEDLYKRLDSKEGEKDIYRIAKARDRSKRDLGNVRFIKYGDGRTIVNEDAIRRRWKEYFFDLFNRKRSGRTEEVDSIGTNPQYNLRKMGRNKAVGPDEIPIEAWRCLGVRGCGG
ncbi:retrovirus-related pol polyprotein LINE-1 [Tanacetum coccineum]